MPHNEPVTTDDAHALQAMSVYYSMLLGCAVTDLRRSGWSIIAARRDDDSMALRYGRRPLVYVVSPLRHPSTPLASTVSTVSPVPAARAGVAIVLPELRGPVSALLQRLAPGELFTAEGLRALDSLVRAIVPRALTPPDEAHTIVRYATTASFRPYRGELTEWIEALDEASEMDRAALGLLARYSGGVYVIRQRGTIASFAGIHPQSPYISEVGVRTDASTLRGHGLARAVVSRATRAILAADRLPLYRHHAGNLPSRRVAEVLGYRVYAESAAYFALDG